MKSSARKDTLKDCWSSFSFNSQLRMLRTLTSYSKSALQTWGCWLDRTRHSSTTFSSLTALCALVKTSTYNWNCSFRSATCNNCKCMPGAYLGHAKDAVQLCWSHVGPVSSFCNLWVWNTGQLKILNQAHQLFAQAPQSWDVCLGACLSRVWERRLPGVLQPANNSIHVDNFRHECSAAASLLCLLGSMYMLVRQLVQNSKAKR